MCYNYRPFNKYDDFIIYYLKNTISEKISRTSETRKFFVTRNFVQELNEKFPRKF